MKPANLYLSLVLIISILNANASETTEFYDAHFEYDQDVLTKTELLKLKEHISTLGLTDAYEVIITGHTDAIGSVEYNKQLSERRTKFILYSLLHFGLDEGVVSIDWKGESDPIDINSNDKGRAKNRRVEIAIKRYTFNTTEDLRSALTKNRAQQFIIDPKTDQLIVGNAGVQVSIPANSFVDRDGNAISGKVTVEMKEALTFGSFHDYGLSTTSGNQLLETGGMVFLDAKDENGNQLSLDQDAQLSMLLPTESKEVGMELFTSNDGGDWQQVGQQPATPTWSSFATFGRYDGPIRPSWNFMPPRMTLDRKPPTKPAPPQKPRAPHKPRPENYEVQPTLINKLFWKSKTQAAEEKFQRHMTEYERKQANYENKMAAYTDELTLYPERVEAYDCQVEEYTQYKFESYKNFKKSDKYLRALKRYEQHYQAQMSAYEDDHEEWRCKQEYRTIEMGEKADQSGFTNRQTMDNYVFTLNQLGWINCDRFLSNPPNMLSQLQVADPDTSNEVVLLVFKDVRSMIGMRRTETGYTMQNYPLNEQAEVFAYKVIGGKPMVCHKTVSGKSSDKLEFKPSSFSEIRSILNSFETKEVSS